MRISVAITAVLFGIKTIARHDRDQARGVGGDRRKRLSDKAFRRIQPV
ncbi:hypothetical protein [Bradyrhizobium sp. JYMT SZCCT0180]|nr:hypothetical protein [Bradyrhizobium sp. JYMT SZCCT0180]MBR1210923.1 hypothetical protein [Bradyrhizobium sp. JYMT SZCCT0180]